MTWKNMLQLAAAAAVLAGLIWVAMYVYWHLKITGAIRAMENQGGGVKGGVVGNREGYNMPDEPLDDLEDAGCRALPYLVSAMFSTKNGAATMACVDLIKKLTAPEGPTASGTIRSECPMVRLQLDDLAEERARKCEPIRTWWNGHAKEYHQNWRLYTGHCPRK